MPPRRNTCQMRRLTFDDCVVEWPDFLIVVASFAELIVLRINARYSMGSLQYLRCTPRTNPEI
jgi:hypothetical protein